MTRFENKYWHIGNMKSSEMCLVLCSVHWTEISLTIRSQC